MNSWRVFDKIFQSLVKSIILYASPIYALRYLQDLEKIQTLFIKRILNLPQCTPDYALRLEVGAPHIRILIFKQLINWTVKILDIQDFRYPKICFLKQKAISQFAANDTKYNWMNQIKQIFFKPINEDLIWDSLTSDLLKDKKTYLLNAYSNYLYNEDLFKCSKSTSLMLYSEIYLQSGAQKYINLGLPMKLLRIFAQIRLLNIHNCKILIDATKHNLIDYSYCQNCGKSNDFLHKVVDCYLFSDIRAELGLKLQSNLDFFSLLEKPQSCKEVKKLVNLVNYVCRYNANL